MIILSLLNNINLPNDAKLWLQMGTKHTYFQKSCKCLMSLTPATFRIKPMFITEICGDRSFEESWKVDRCMRHLLTKDKTLCSKRQNFLELLLSEQVHAWQSGQSTTKWLASYWPSRAQRNTIINVHFLGNKTSNIQFIKFHSDEKE